MSDSTVLSETVSRLCEILEDERARLRRELGEKFNQTARRLRQCGTAEELHAELLDSTIASCERAVLFTFSGRNVRVVGWRGYPSELGDALLRFEAPLNSAPAIANAAESADTIIAMRVAGQLSERLARLLGEAHDRKCYLFPVVTRQRLVAVLYADGDTRGVDTGTLEMLAHLAGAALDARSVAGPAPRADLVTISGVTRPARPLAPPEWTGLSGDEQELHLRAQRFGRVRVAEMRLYKAGAVKSGRENLDLYGELRQEIDAARDVFRAQFAESSPSMIDYLHLELVRTLANNDAARLGPDYPGPLV